MTDLLALEAVSKTFSGVPVLRDVALTVRPGEIHALLGQNGSGKSTLIKILSGFHAPDPGAVMRVRGEDVPLPLDVGDPLKLGIAFVHQDLGLADDMSLVDNLSIGEYQMRGRWRIDWRAQEAAVAASLREFGVDDDVRQDVSALSSQARRALVAIVRAVTQIRRRHGSGVLVLDEPTVYLPRDEVSHLQDVVRQLARDGVGVLYVTHRLDELRDFADRATVLRDGRVVGEVDVAAQGVGGLVQLITGAEVDLGSARIGEPPGGQEVLRVEGLTGERVEDVSFSLAAGEVVGIAGLVGMGQEEVLGLIFGATDRTSGTVTVDGSAVPADPRKAIKQGVAFLPSDRPVRSAAVTESAADNITLPVLTDRFFRSGRLRKREERVHVGALLDAFDVRPRNPELELARFSGGNQQKALMAKWLQSSPRLLLLDEPVQGVDVGAKAQIFDRLRETAAAGCALVIASSEYDDLALLCDRVLVMIDGKVSQTLVGDQVTRQRIAAACYGAQGA
ncbi:MAG: sugar transporter ATP-binding protein [Conexibacter sp.]|nr:sugar transporter ATP-binding protein [Conexibacter sp.]